MYLPVFFNSKKEKRLQTGWRLILQFILMVIASGLFSLFILPVAKLTPGTYKIAIAQVAGFLGVITSVYLARYFLDKRTFSSLGFELSKQSIGDLLFGFILGAGVMLILFAIEWLAGWIRQPLLIDWKPESLSLLILAIIYYVMIGFQEETLARGYWLQNLSGAMNIIWAVLLSSLFFAVGYLGNAGINPLALLSLIGAGVLLSYGWVRTGQLWLPIGLHIGWNFFESALGFPVSGLEGFHLVSFTTQGPEIIIGGAFGPESGLISFFVMGLAAAGIYIWTKKRANG